VATITGAGETAARRAQQVVRDAIVDGTGGVDATSPVAPAGTCTRPEAVEEHRAAHPHGRRAHTALRAGLR